MNSYIQQLEPYSHFLISTALGMLVGLQREWADTHAAGIRTFTFVSLFGTACALISESYGSWFIGLGLIAIILFAVMAHYQMLRSDGGLQKSMVTGISLLVVFLVGIMIRKELLLPAAALTCLIAMILHIKLELHSFADKVTSKELHTVMQFLLITLVVLPLMPNRSFGPSGAINLYNIWLMVIVIFGIGLGGYAIQKLTGSRAGVIGSGLIGGTISSTATTFTYARLSIKQAASYSSYGLIILIAWLVVYFRVFIEVSLISGTNNILVPLVIMVIATMLMIAWVWRKNLTWDNSERIICEPIDLKTAVSFAVFYSILIIVFSYFKDDLSSGALYFVTFVAGILDIDAITMTTARLVSKGLLSPDKAVAHVFIALLANTIFKGVLCLFIGGKSLFKIILQPWVGSILLQLLIIGWYC